MSRLADLYRERADLARRRAEIDRATANVDDAIAAEHGANDAGPAHVTDTEKALGKRIANRLRLQAGR